MVSENISQNHIRLCFFFFISHIASYSQSGEALISNLNVVALGPVSSFRVVVTECCIDYKWADNKSFLKFTQIWTWPVSVCKVQATK